MLDMIEDVDRQSEVWQAPTGAGKTVMFLAAARYCLQTDRRVLILIYRTSLLDQLARTVRDAKIRCGIIASGRPKDMDVRLPMQLAMTQTLLSRCERTEAAGEAEYQGLPEADVIIVDEAHQQAGDSVSDLLAWYRRQGAKIVGVTATPVEIDHVYDRLRRGPKNKQLRRPALDPPMHLPALMFAGPEIDSSKLELQANGEYSIEEIRRQYPSRIYAEVIGEYLRLNPQRRPTLLFAPGVQESLWFADRLTEAGISAAHIDGDSVHVDGRDSKGSKRRHEVIERLRTGDIKVVCNRFVLREGIDIPELYHIILACPIGSLMGYIQVVGRVLRYHPSLDDQEKPHVIIQDHGGNWWRHGSPNEDRPWEDYFHLSNRVISQMRLDSFRDPPTDPNESPPKQPIACAKCGGIRASGLTCPHCGHQSARSRRTVLQMDGRLSQRDGDPIRPRYVQNRTDTERLWISCYHRAKHSNRTLSAARGLFVRENGYWPVAKDGTASLPFMPRSPIDWYLPAAKVSKEKLF